MGLKGKIVYSIFIYSIISGSLRSGGPVGQVVDVSKPQFPYFKVGIISYLHRIILWLKQGA